MQDLTPFFLLINTTWMAWTVRLLWLIVSLIFLAMALYAAYGDSGISKGQLAVLFLLSCVCYARNLYILLQQRKKKQVYGLVIGGIAAIAIVLSITFLR